MKVKRILLWAGLLLGLWCLQPFSHAADLSRTIPLDAGGCYAIAHYHSLNDMQRGNAYKEYRYYKSTHTDKSCDPSQGEFDSYEVFTPSAIYALTGMAVQQTEYFDQNDHLLGTRYTWHKDGIEHFRHHDGQGHCIGSWSINSNPGALKYTGWEVVISRQSGKPLSVSNYDTGILTVYRYNALHELLSYTTARTVFYLPAETNARHITYFDGSGKVFKTRDYFWDAAGNRRLHEYDAAGTLVRNTRAPTPDSH